MSDESVAAALRSPARLVVVEAPAGCGKTFQGAEYAREVSGEIGSGRVLILAHTHAACDVFASRASGADGRVDTRTIDSQIVQVASAYHEALGLPAESGAWARSQVNGYAELAARVAAVLRTSPMIARSLSQRYPVVVCDEHQDASADQHALAMAFHEGGASVRVFGDPMQRIYGSRKGAEITADIQRWERLKQCADSFDRLDVPHRWLGRSSRLGEWILTARAALQSGGQVDLRSPLPPGVSVVVAENGSRRQRGGYQVVEEDAKRSIYSVVRSAESILVLAAHKETVEALRAFFGRRVPIWEGHVRDGLSTLVGAVQQHRGEVFHIAQAAVDFLNHVATGFSPSGYGNAFLDEVRRGCVGKRRGKPATLQILGRMILEQPDHRGVAKVLQRVGELLATDAAFKTVKIDYHREYWDAVHLGTFDDPGEGFAELSRRRSHARLSLPAKVISTIHKAKGLDCTDVLIMPCDVEHFGDSPAARCRLYVAMSRATRSLTLVVSRLEPSPLFAL